MDLVVSRDSIEMLDCDVIVAGFFEDERPLGGPLGFVDWRLNGLLSRHLIEGRLKGSWREMILIPSGGRIAPRMILAVGLGQKDGYSRQLLRALSVHLIGVFKNLRLGSICVALPHGDDYRIDPADIVAIFLESVTDLRRVWDGKPDAEWLANLRLFFLGEGESEDTTMKVIATFASGDGNILKPRLFVSEEGHLKDYRGKVSF